MSLTLLLLHGLGRSPTAVGDHVYHVTSAGLVRRVGLGGADQPLIGGPIDQVEVTADGIAWVSGGHLRVAPLPP